MTQIKWIFENMKGSRWKFYLGLIMHNCLCMPLVILAPMVITAFVDQVFTNGDSSNAVMLIGLYLGLNVLRALTQYGYSLILDSASADVLANFRTTLYKKLQTLTPSFYSTTRTAIS